MLVRAVGLAHIKKAPRVAADRKHEASARKKRIDLGLEARAPTTKGLFDQLRDAERAERRSLDVIEQAEPRGVEGEPAPEARRQPRAAREPERIDGRLRERLRARDELLGDDALDDLLDQLDPARRLRALRRHQRRRRRRPKTSAGARASQPSVSGSSAGG